MTFLKGWRTRLLAGAVALLGVVEAIDPNLISTALGLDAQGRALITVGIAVAIFALRQITSTPPGKRANDLSS